jgi:hypothetical protein
VSSTVGARFDPAHDVHRNCSATRGRTGGRRGPWAPALLLAALVGAAACDKSPTTPSVSTLTARIGACTYTLATDAVPASIPAGGGAFSVRLTTDATCSWGTSVPDKLYRFLTVAPAQGVGSATIQVTVAAHTGSQSRPIGVTVATMAVGTVQSAAPPPVAGPNAILLYSGTVGETLSYGQAGVATTDHFKVTAPNVNGSAFTVMLDVRTLAPPPYPWPDAFNIIMEGPTGQKLAAGTYDNAVRWTNGVPTTSNQLSVSFSGMTCGSSFEGRFEIFEIAYDSRDFVQRLHFKVVQRCLQDAPGTALTLEAWYPSKGAFQ